MHKVHRELRVVVITTHQAANKRNRGWYLYDKMFLGSHQPPAGVVETGIRDEAELGTHINI